MEQVLEMYARPYDARHPVVCMDEQPKQLIDDVRQPVVAPDGMVREDFEYVRNGVCVAWMFVEPLAGRLARGAGNGTQDGGRLGAAGQGRGRGAALRRSRADHAGV